MKILALALCILTLCACSFAADAPKPGIEVGVKDFGAVGDGKADDTAAIRKAIEAAGFGGTVRFPMGTYKLSATLDLTAVHLLGNISGGFPSDATVMPMLVVTHTDGPAIRCGNFSSVHGLALQYLNVNWEKPVKYPPTILLAGNGISVSNVKIWGAYDAIAADGKSNIGRVNLENIFLPEVVNVGVYLTKAYDIPTMRNVECFCTNKYFLEHGVGFKLGRLDEFHAANCFVIGAQTGFLFLEDKTPGGGNTYGGLSNCSTDFCGYGYVVESGARLRVTNGSYLNHAAAFKIMNPTACVIVHGAIIQSNGDHIVQITDCGSVMLSACHFQKAFENAKAHGVYITGGRNIIVTGCTFDAFGPGVYLGGKADKVTVSSNIFESEKFAHVDDKLPKTAKRVLLGNQ
jgi:hypothetical protein